MFNYIKKRKIQSALKKNERQHQFINFLDIKGVLILFDYKDLSTMIEIAEDLKRKGKYVFLWTFDPDKNAIPAQRQSLSLQTITGKNVSSIGTISKELIAVFNSQLYDTIIDLTNGDQYPLQYLLSKNTAQFSIGLTQSEDRLYDFILLKKEEMTLKEIYDQIKFYLNSVVSRTNNS